MQDKTDEAEIAKERTLGRKGATETPAEVVVDEVSETSPDKRKALKTTDTCSGSGASDD